MRLRSICLLFALAAISMLLVACAPAAPVPTEIPPVPTQLTAASAATVGPEQPSSPGDRGTSVAATPTARSGQEATDPTTVNLASGKPTLVKFFAFW
jgi:hypothetical protein